jgi:hypothetical protein
MSILRSSLARQFPTALRKWAKEIQSADGVIVAISRKGPRLLESLVREKILEPEILERTVSELAIPLLPELTPVILIDDSVIHGSTFDHMIRLCRAKGVASVDTKTRSVVGMPLAVSTAVPPQFLQHVSNNGILLNESEIVPYVTSVVGSFKLLGKPYDIDHPIVEFGFQDSLEVAPVEMFIQAVGEQLNSRPIAVNHRVPTSKGNILCKSWTILLGGDETCAGSGKEARAASSDESRS